MNNQPPTEMIKSSMEDMVPTVTEIHTEEKPVVKAARFSILGRRQSLPRKCKDNGNSFSEEQSEAHGSEEIHDLEKIKVQFYELQWEMEKLLSGGLKLPNHSAVKKEYEEIVLQFLDLVKSIGNEKNDKGVDASETQNLSKLDIDKSKYRAVHVRLPKDVKLYLSKSLLDPNPTELKPFVDENGEKCFVPDVNLLQSAGLSLTSSPHHSGRVDHEELEICGKIIRGWKKSDPSLYKRFYQSMEGSFFHWESSTAGTDERAERQFYVRCLVCGSSLPNLAAFKLHIDQHFHLP